MPDLEATYRRLLLAYPRSYRRERGLEILTTLLDAAGPQARRPSWRDAVDLIVGGIRYRFAPPRGWAYRIAATLVAAFAGFALAGGVTLVAWTSSPTMPRTTDIPALFGVSPETKGTQIFDPAPLHHDWLGKGTPWTSEGWSGSAPAPGYVSAGYRPEADLGTTITTMRQRLSAQGWQLGELVGWEAGYVFWTGHDDELVRVQGLFLDGSKPSITVEIHRTEPGHVTAVAIGALVLGFGFGWLLACALLRRSIRLTAGWRIVALTLSIPAIAATTMLDLACAGGVLMLFSTWGPAQHHWLSFAATLASMNLVTILATLSLAGLAVVALVGSTTSRAEPGPVAQSST